MLNAAHGASSLRTPAHRVAPSFQLAEAPAPAEVDDAEQAALEKRKVLNAKVKLLKTALTDQTTIKLMIRLFVKYDRNGNNMLDMDEFKEVVTDILKLECADDEACEALFKDFDYDGSGEITHYECLRFMLLSVLQSSVARVISLFKLWDADCNGTVDKDEFLHGFETMGFDVKVMRDAIYKLFDELDEDGSGDLDYEELSRTLRRPNIAREVAAGLKDKATTQSAPSTGVLSPIMVARSAEKLRRKAAEARQNELIAKMNAARQPPPPPPAAHLRRAPVVPPAGYPRYPTTATMQQRAEAAALAAKRAAEAAALAAKRAKAATLAANSGAPRTPPARPPPVMVAGDSDGLHHHQQQRPRSAPQRIAPQRIGGLQHRTPPSRLLQSRTAWRAPPASPQQTPQATSNWRASPHWPVAGFLNAQY